MHIWLAFTAQFVEIRLTVQLVKYPDASRYMRNLTPDLENQSTTDLEVSCGLDLFQIEIVRCQKGQYFN